MERWNSPAEKEARRERKTGNAPKVSEKGGWIVHRESVRKKDGRAGHRDGRHTAERRVEGTKETCRREEEFEGVGCKHRRGRRRFLQRCRRRRRRRHLEKRLERDSRRKKRQLSHFDMVEPTRNPTVSQRQNS